MVLRNLWSLDPSELLVAEELGKQFRDSELCFPLKDRGVDLILVRHLPENLRKAISFQVKGSRTWETPDEGCGGWHKLSRQKLLKDSQKLDYYVFVFFQLKEGKRTLRVEPRFLIIPTQDLLKRIGEYKGREGEMLNFQFNISKDGRVYDWRGLRRGEGKEEEARNYSSYLDNWTQISER